MNRQSVLNELRSRGDACASAAADRRAGASVSARIATAENDRIPQRKLNRETALIFISWNNRTGGRICRLHVQTLTNRLRPRIQNSKPTLLGEANKCFIAKPEQLTSDARARTDCRQVRSAAFIPLQRSQ